MLHILPLNAIPVSNPVRMRGFDFTSVSRIDRLLPKAPLSRLLKASTGLASANRINIAETSIAAINANTMAKIRPIIPTSSLFSNLIFADRFIELPYPQYQPLTGQCFQYWLHAHRTS